MKLVKEEVQKRVLEEIDWEVQEKVLRGIYWEVQKRVLGEVLLGVCDHIRLTLESCN